MSKKNCFKIAKRFPALLVVIMILWLLWLLFLSRRSQTKVLVGGNLLKVEIMRTEEERAHGLSDRKFLCSDCGLLFIFDRSGVYPFWMRRMYFDIDILWVAGDEVVDITYGARKPPLEDFDSPKEIYQSQIPIDKVLEVNAGWVVKNGLKIGDKISLK